MVQGSPVQDSSTAVFDPTYPKEELRGISSKYRQASQFLQGIGLNPDNAIDIGNNHYAVTNGTTALVESSNPSQLSFNASSFRASDADSAPGSDDAAQGPAGPQQGAFLPVYGGTGVEPLRDFVSGTEDLLYYGDLAIGTPAQTLSVDIDTGSADLWLPANCGNCHGRQFDAARSSTYRPTGQTFAVTYGSGHVSGVLATDVVTLGGLTVSAQAFGAVTSASSEFAGQPNDGLLGLAFGTIAQSRAPPFFENLVRARSVRAPVFGVHLERGRVQGSALCLGCYDSSKTAGPLVWVPVTSKTYWSVSLDAITAGGQTIDAGGIYAAIDTGTTLIYLPDALAAALYRALGGRPATQYGRGFYTYPCAAPAAIAFVLGGHAFALSAQDFNLGRTAARSSECVGGILSLGQEFPDDLAIIGDEFLKSWYSVYDYSNGARVGFAPDVNNSS